MRAVIGWNYGKVAMIGGMQTHLILTCSSDVSIYAHAPSHHSVVIPHINYIFNIKNKYLISPLIDTLLQGTL